MMIDRDTRLFVVTTLLSAAHTSQALLVPGTNVFGDLELRKITLEGIRIALRKAGWSEEDMKLTDEDYKLIDNGLTVVREINEKMKGDKELLYDNR